MVDRKTIQQAKKKIPIKKKAPIKAPIVSEAAKPAVFNMDVYKFHDNIRMGSAASIPSYVAEIYERVFEKIAPAGVHWFLLRSAISYELLYRQGKLNTEVLMSRYHEALKLDINAVSDQRSRSILKALIAVESKDGLREEPKPEPKEPIMAAKKKVEKTVAKKTVAKKEPKAKKSTTREVGKTSGVGVQETWIKLFAQNEKAKKSARMTDEQIATAMHKEFPGRESKIFDQVQAVRNKYNKGGFKSVGVPAVLSQRYDEQGNVASFERKPKAVKAPKAKAPVKKAVPPSPVKKAKKVVKKTTKAAAAPVEAAPEA